MLQRIDGAGDGVTLAVQDEGEGPPVLLIHGFPDSHRLWRHQVPALVGAGKRVSLPTCAASASPTGPRRSPTTDSATA